MRFRHLGASGLQVSAIGLGCNNFGGRTDEAASIRVIHAALECGITLFDTADIYSGGASEEIVGRALGRRRPDVIIATKFGHPMGDGPHAGGASRHTIRRALEASLRRLGTDYIDLYQIHVPDDDTPIAETLHTLHDLVRAGTVRYVGCSNFAAWQVVDAAWTARTAGWEGFISAQNAYSLLNRSVEGELIPACGRFGLGILPYHPLAGGMLTGKYRRDAPLPPGTRLTTSEAARNRFLTDENWAKVEALTAFAQERGRSLLDVAIGGLAARPLVASVIAGATSPEQVEANVRAGEWIPSPQDVATLDEITA